MLELNASLVVVDARQNAELGGFASREYSEKFLKNKLKAEANAAVCGWWLRK